ncbi:hypothetical protein [Pseudorhodoferax sp.]|uniref:hypothetical protein n=1 Tax=Pseudorhodoferax sp. TaxID=1993553 RepID=UPI0039E678E3
MRRLLGTAGLLAALLPSLAQAAPQYASSVLASGDSMRTPDLGTSAPLADPVLVSSSELAADGRAKHYTGLDAAGNAA